MREGICYVVGAGENYGIDFKPTGKDMVIAADAGLDYLQKCGIAVNLAIGDFDTLGMIPTHPNVIALNVEKDETDMAAAVCEGIKRGYSTFHIYCGTGGRIDHTIANLQMLAWLSEGKRQGYLFDKDSIITAIKDGELAFEVVPSGYLSVFAYGEKAEGVCLRGLKYTLENATLTTGTYALGVSNEFIGEKSSISVGNGTLFVVFPRSEKEKISLKRSTL